MTLNPENNQSNRRADAARRKYLEGHQPNQSLTPTSVFPEEENFPELQPNPSSSDQPQEKTHAEEMPLKKTTGIRDVTAAIRDGIKRDFDKLTASVSRQLFMVGDLTVSFPVIQEGDIRPKAKKHSLHVNQIAGKFTPKEKKPWVLRHLPGKSFEQASIGLPIIITIPLHDQADIDARKNPKENAPAYRLGKAPKKPLSILNAGESMPNIKSIGKPSAGAELVAYMEISPITPLNTYLNQVRVGIAAVYPKDRSNLYSIKSTQILTIQGSHPSGETLNLSEPTETIDGATEQIMGWFAQTQYSIKKDDLSTAFTVGTMLNCGIEDFWKTIQSRQYFGIQLQNHPEAVVLAMNTFFTSNRPSEALPTLNDFFSRILHREIGPWEDFVDQARKTISEIQQSDPDFRLSINLGIGALHNFLLQTTSRIHNAENASKLLKGIIADDDAANQINNAVSDKEMIPLQQEDPLSVMLMSPRILSQFVEFAVQKWIPLTLRANEALYQVVTEELKSHSLAAETLKDFIVITRLGFQSKVKELRKQMPEAGQKAAEQMADAVVAMMNQALKDAYGANPDLKSPTQPAFNVYKTTNNHPHDGFSH